MKSFMEEWLATKTPADWPGRGLGRMPWMRITPDQDMTKAVARVRTSLCVCERESVCVCAVRRAVVSGALRLAQRTHASSQALVSMKLLSSLTQGKRMATRRKPSMRQRRRKGKRMQ